MPASGTTYEIKAGDTVQLKKLFTYSISVTNDSEAFNIAEISVSGASVGSASTVPISIAYLDYKNTLYADGLILSNASNKFVGLLPKSMGDIILARCQNLGLALTPDGLMQCSWASGSLVKTRMNPLVMIIDAVENNGYLTFTYPYNIINKTIQRHEHVDRGTYYLYHSFGLGTKYAITGVSTQWERNRYISPANITATSFEIDIVCDHLRQEGNFRLFIYDYNTY